MPESTPSPAVAEAIARIERSWQRLNAELDQIPRQRMLESGAVGVWSIKDLLGHIAYWDSEAPGAGQRHLTGEPDPDYDFDAINAREAALRARAVLAVPFAPASVCSALCASSRLSKTGLLSVPCSRYSWSRR